MIVLLISSLLLTGCVSVKKKFLDNVKAQGIKPLTAPEISKLVSGATMKSSSGAGEYRGYYSADGEIEVDMYWQRGETNGRGKWKTTEDGLFCEHFGIMVNEERCYSVYPGKTKGDYTLVQVSGPFSEYLPDGMVQSYVTPGR